MISLLKVHTHFPEPNQHAPDLHLCGGFTLGSRNPHVPPTLWCLILNARNNDEVSIQPKDAYSELA